MDCIDFHTHHPSRQGERVIQDGVHTWGIHPWKATSAHDFPASRGTLMAIGECGLDVHAEASIEQQMQLLIPQLHLSMEWHLPVILHCVKCLDHLLALRKEMKPTEPWILHGFRGKPRQMESLLSAGFHISFGFRFNPQSLCLCPTDRLLLETDDDPRPVELLYHEAARLRGIPEDELIHAMQEQFRTLFLKNVTTPQERLHPAHFDIK
ncbi:MAG: TatD family hydrolase [Bacteroidaceae bacterium]